MNRSLLVITLLVWGALRALFYVGYYMEDAPGFVTEAVYWASGTWRPRTYLAGLRVGTYIPAGVFIGWLGKTEIALSTWPLLSSLAGTLALLGICRRLQLGAWSWLAVVLWIAYPGDIIFSTVLMPDAIQTGWFLVAIYLAIAGSIGATRKAALLGSGLVLGGCYLVRENAVLLLPVLLAAPLLIGSPNDPLRARLRPAGLILAGAIAVPAIEAAFYGIAAGAPGLRFVVSHSYYEADGAFARHGLNADPWTIPGSLLPPLEWVRVSMPWFTLHPGQAYHAYAFVVGLLAWTLGLLMAARLSGSERRAFLWISLWAWWPVLYHQFGSQSLTSYVPIHRLPRQLVLYAPAALVLAAWTAAQLVRHRATAPRPARGGVAALIAALLVHASGVVQGLGVQTTIIAATTTIYDRLVANLAGYRGRIYIDSAEVGLLDYFLNPLDGERVVQVFDLFSASSCDSLQQSLVVTNSNPGWSFSPRPALLADALERLPCLTRVPDNWTPVSAAPWLPERIYSVPSGASSSRPPS